MSNVLFFAIVMGSLWFKVLLSSLQLSSGWCCSTSGENKFLKQEIISRLEKAGKPFLLQSEEKNKDLVNFIIHYLSILLLNGLWECVDIIFFNHKSNQIKTFHIYINSLKFHIHIYSVKIIHCFMVGERCPEYMISLKFFQQDSFYYR